MHNSEVIYLNEVSQYALEVEQKLRLQASFHSAHLGFHSCSSFMFLLLLNSKFVIPFKSLSCWELSLHALPSDEIRRALFVCFLVLP